MLVRSILVAALTTWCSIATAATGSVALTDESGLRYFINTNITFSTSSSASGAESEASYVRPGPATTVAGAYVLSSQNDMFDGYNAMCVSSAPAFCSSGSATTEMYVKNGASTFELAGRQVVFPLHHFANGIIGYRKVYVPENDEYSRWLNIFTNPTAAPITFTMNTSNNLGSDSNTLIVDSSVGPGTVLNATSTQWVVTMQNYNGTTSGSPSTDPRIAHVIQGPGAPVPASLVHFQQGDDNPYWSFTMTLQPGRTAIVMNLVSGQESKAAAIAKARELAKGPGTVLQGLTGTERSQIVNFNLGCGAIHDQCHDAIVDDSGHCTLIPLNATPCNDNNVCTTTDHCVDGECVGSDPMPCAASDATCQTATCDPTLGCQVTNAASTTTCDDHSACTDADHCDGAGHCAGTANTSTAACDDGNPCTTGEVCNGAGVCGSGTASTGVACDDKNDCTNGDACDNTGHCVGAANVGQACNDKNDCTDGDVCNASGVCAGTANSKQTCGDGTCKQGLCIGGQCIVDVMAANGRACDTGDACESNDVCFNGECLAQPKECAVSSSQCVTATCKEGTGCVNEPRTSGTCDDNDPCTVDDACSTKGCAGVAMDCSATGDSCHVGFCLDGQCVATAVADGTACDDGNAATKGDVCSGGVCAGNRDVSYSTCSSLGSGGAAAFAALLLATLLRRRRR